MGNYNFPERFLQTLQVSRSNSTAVVTCLVYRCFYITFVTDSQIFAFRSALRRQRRE